MRGGIVIWSRRVTLRRTDGEKIGHLERGCHAKEARDAREKHVRCQSAVESPHKKGKEVGPAAT